MLGTLKDLPFINKLKDAGGEIFAVGGCVRDFYMERDFSDIDLLITGLSLSEIINLLGERANLVGESFGVIKYIDDNEQEFDIAVPRKERKISSGHTGFEIITEGITLLDDLGRRDFTINSMAYNIMTNELIDPYGGIKDIELRLIKHINDDAFLEDPLRFIRAIRFENRFLFNISNKTTDLITNNSSLIKEISGERIYLELEKIIELNISPLNIVDRLIRLNLIQTFLDVEIQFKYKNLFHFNGKKILMCDLLFSIFNTIVAGNNNISILLKKLKVPSNVSKEVTILNKGYWLYGFKDNQFIPYMYESIRKCENIINSPIFINICTGYNIDNIINPKDLCINGSDIIEMGIENGKSIKFILITLYGMVVRNEIENKKENLIEYLTYFFK